MQRSARKPGEIAWQAGCSSYPLWLLGSQKTSKPRIRRLCIEALARPIPILRSMWDQSYSKQLMSSISFNQNTLLLIIMLVIALFSNWYWHAMELWTVCANIPRVWNAELGLCPVDSGLDGKEKCIGHLYAQYLWVFEDKKHGFLANVPNQYLYIYQLIMEPSATCHFVLPRVTLSCDVRFKTPNKLGW